MGGEAQVQVGVVGGGFVGVTTAVVLAERGASVHLFEQDPDRRQALAAGALPFHEPGVQEALAKVIASGAMTLADPSEPQGQLEAFVICVGTPVGEDGRLDVSQLETAVDGLVRKHAGQDRFLLFVVKSTVAPGTTRGVVLPRLAALGTLGKEFGLVVAPEFLREGQALEDARQPDRIVLGSADSASRSAAERLWVGWAAPVVHGTWEEAEIAKLASNAFLATKVTMANEIANLADRVGADVDVVMDAVGRDPRIGSDFLRAGPGFGGSCFPKDLQGLAAVGRAHGTPLVVVESVLEANRAQALRAVDLAQGLLGSLRKKRAAVLGLAFKANTSDVRGTRALPIIRGLRAAGASVVGYDPVAGPEYERLDPETPVAATLDEALADADVVVVQTEWSGWAELDPRRMRAAMRSPRIVDTRRVLDADAFRSAGFLYAAIGRPGPEAR